MQLGRSKVVPFKNWVDFFLLFVLDLFVTNWRSYFTIFNKRGKKPHDTSPLSSISNLAKKWGQGEWGGGGGVELLLLGWREKDQIRENRGNWAYLSVNDVFKSTRDLRNESEPFICPFWQPNQVLFIWSCTGILPSYFTLSNKIWKKENGKIELSMADVCFTAKSDPEEVYM